MSTFRIVTFPAKTATMLTEIHREKAPLVLAYLEVLNAISDCRVPMRVAVVLRRAFDPDVGLWANPYDEVEATEAQHALSRLLDERLPDELRGMLQALRARIEVGIRDARLAERAARARPSEGGSECGTCGYAPCMCDQT